MFKGVCVCLRVCVCVCLCMCVRPRVSASFLAALVIITVSALMCSQSKLLVWDMYENPSWEPLCEFLGVPQPSIPFPKPNKFPEW